MRYRYAFLSVLVLLAALPLTAHDLWIAPERFDPAVGELIQVHLQVGEPHLGKIERVARNPGRLLRFAAYEKQAVLELTGIDGRQPAAFYRPSTPGGAILVYEGSYASIELAAAKFEHYLLEEGLDGISRQRAARGRSSLPGRERYRRSVKALLAVAGEAGQDRKLGLPFELVLETDPNSIGTDTALTVRCFFEDGPLEGTLVELTSLDRPGPAIGRRSDAEGRMSFPAPGGGRWVLTAVHMEPSPAGSGVDWDSSWTSLSWEVPSPP